MMKLKEEKEIQYWCMLCMMWMRTKNVILSEKRGIKDLELYDFFYMKCPEQANLWRQKEKQLLPRTGELSGNGQTHRE